MYKVIRFIAYFFLYLALVNVLYWSFKQTWIEDETMEENMERKKYVDFWRHRWAFIGAIFCSSIIMAIIISIMPDASICDRGLIVGILMIILTIIGLEYAILEIEKEDDKKAISKSKSIRLFEKNAFFIFYMFVTIHAIRMLFLCFPNEKEIEKLVKKLKTDV